DCRDVRAAQPCRGCAAGDVRSTAEAGDISQGGDSASERREAARMATGSLELLRARWAAEDMPTAPRSYLQEARRRFLRNRTGLVALAVLVLLATTAILAPVLTPHE